MKKFAFLILAFALLLIINSIVFGQIESGLNEFNLVASFASSGEGRETSSVIHLATSFGHFFSKTLEVGGNLSLTKAKEIDPFGSISGFVSIHPNLKFGNNVYTFFGGQAGIGFNSGDDPIIYGGFFGMKMFVTKGGAVTLQPYYLRQQFKNSGIHNYGILVGVSIFF